MKKRIFIFFITVCCVTLIVRFFDLQIKQHNKYRGIATNNRIRVVDLEAPRGIIYDRNGKILVNNKFQYNISIIPSEIDTLENTCEKLSEILDISEQKLKKRIEENWRGEFQPVLVARDVNFRVLTKIEEHKLGLPGVIYNLDPYRSYPSPVNLSHTLGYLGEMEKGEYEELKEYGYDRGDLIGWKGLERKYETLLKGEDGYKYVQVNALGRMIGNVNEMENRQPKSGDDLYLTINMELQKFTESILSDNKGVIIVNNPENGEILSAVSKPDYNPEIFSGRVEGEVWKNLKTAKNTPLYNRISNGEYPPASTIKMLTAMKSLNKNVVDRNWEIECKGEYTLGRRNFGCWSVHGDVDMEKSIIQSCDIYYYNLIQKMNLNTWSNTFNEFGFGKRTGVDLPEERKGTLPNRSYLDEKYGKNGWTEGFKLNLVIGQGEMSVTPLQMTKYISALATKGKIITPHFAKKYFDKDENRFKFFNTKEDSIAKYSRRTWNFINESIYGVVNSQNGTGGLAKVEAIDVYGKTGTAQNSHGENHAWFIGYAEHEGEKISLTILLENGGSGGKDAAPLAQEIFSFYNKQYWSDSTKSEAKNEKTN